jgi:4-hydroxy-tetrahydrodipicolinate synthase
MRNGGVGTISATANVNPAAIYELYAECSGVRRGERRANRKALATASASKTELECQQANLNLVRDVFSNSKFPSMIAALKQAIAIYRNDPEWARVRPPIVERSTEQAELLAAELKAIGFAMPGIGATSKVRRAATLSMPAGLSARSVPSARRKSPAH